MIKHIVSNSGLTVVFPDGPMMIHRSSPDYPAAMQALQASDMEALRASMDRRHALSKFSEGCLSINDSGEIIFENHPIGNHLSKIIKSGTPKDSWSVIKRFLLNVLENPNQRARLEIDSILSECSLPITEDGCILAFKLVDNEYVDPQIKTHICKPGRTLTLPRDTLHRGSKEATSRGFSAGGKSYLDANSYFCGKVVTIKINPADIVGVYLSPYKELTASSITIVKDGVINFTEPFYDGTTCEPIVTGR